MKNKKVLSLLLSLTLLAGACKDFEDFQLDPNRTTQAQPGLLLTNIEVAAFNEISLNAGLASRYLVFMDGSSESQYYGWQRADFDDYNNLRQVMKMEEEAQRLEQENYLALAKFFKSYWIIQLTQTFGDVPYSQALNGSTGEFTPEYDRQEDVYLKVLEDLKIANESLSTENGVITGDVIYGGDVEKWRKLINSFNLRVLMSLSNKEGNEKLQVQERFQEIFSNPAKYPLMESNEDNGALPFYELEGNRYPLFNNNALKTAYFMEESFVNRLKELNDPRLWSFADPEARGSNLAEEDMDAYGGLGGSALLSVNTSRLGSGEGSPIDARYHSQPTNEKSIALGYAELQFTLAEAAQRGWINSDPELHYNKGIEASMEFYGVDKQEIIKYLENSGVKYNSASGLVQILTQKHIAFFMNSGWEAFYNQRRTGIPEFSVDGGGVANGSKVPKRWMYPESELELNAAHVKSAISRQFGGSDDINAEMWLLQQE